MIKLFLMGSVNVKEKYANYFSKNGQSQEKLEKLVDDELKFMDSNFDKIYCDMKHIGMTKGEAEFMATEKHASFNANVKILIVILKKKKQAQDHIKQFAEAFDHLFSNCFNLSSDEPSIPKCAVLTGFDLQAYWDEMNKE